LLCLDVNDEARSIAVTLSSTEARHAHAVGLQNRPPDEALEILLAAQSEAVAQVRYAVPALAAAAEIAADVLHGEGRLAYAGAGSSGVMALSDAVELAGTFGLPPARTPVLFAGGAQSLLHMAGAVEDDAGAAAAEVVRLDLGGRDALIAVSASGATPYTVAAAEAARARGVAVIGVANVAGSPLLRAAQVAVLLDTGPEVVAGSTRMGAATAQKIALNMLSTLTALRLGHVHDGHMVNIVADNAKLRTRAARIVAEIADVGGPAAEAALAAAQGSVKAAILIAAGAEASDATRRLARLQGRLDLALATLKTERTDPNGSSTGRRS
jgi:N-acetylmuramic acid 6-phosphate etherase